MLGHGNAVRQTLGPGPEPRHPLRPAATRADSRLRIAHLALLVEGLVIGVLGGVALAWSTASLRIGAEGTPMLGLALTPLHGALLMTAGTLAMLVCFGRWPTVAFSAAATVSWAALAVVCAARTARHTPGLLGFDARDTVFDAVLGAYNLTICLLLIPAVPLMWQASRSRAPHASR